MSGGNSVRVLILGASYGLLPGVRLALAGHAVTLIGRATELAAMAEAPLRLNITARRGGGNFALEVPPGGNAALCTPDEARPEAAIGLTHRRC